MLAALITFGDFQHAYCNFCHFLPHHTVVRRGTYTVVYCVFLFVCLFVRLRISQRWKKLGAWNFACVLAYYPDRSFPLWWRLARGESRGPRHYFPHHALWLWNTIPMSDARSSAQISKPAATVGGHSELAAEASTKAVWWSMRLASLLTHLLSLFMTMMLLSLLLTLSLCVRATGEDLSCTLS